MHRTVALAALLLAAGCRSTGAEVQTIDPADAQGEEPARVWGGAGMGAAAEGVAGAAQLVWQHAPHHAELRAFTSFDPYGYDNTALGEVAALYGRVLVRRYGYATVASGVAVGGRGACAGGGDCGFVGVPIVLEAGVRPLPVLGIGVQAFGTLNAESFYGGLVVMLQLGWMPSRPRVIPTEATNR